MGFSRPKYWCGLGHTRHLITLIIGNVITDYLGFPGGSEGKESACNAGDPAPIPGLGGYPGGGYGNPLHYSCLANPHGQRSLGGYSPRGSQSQT